jgi:HK97 gp10 family phage protein
MGVSIKLEGIGQVDQIFKELAAQIGDKKANSKILVPAVREAMRPVLAMAKSNAPVDTGTLQRTLQTEARRPTKRDRRSKYITQTDTVIAIVTTAPAKKLKKLGIKSDARAIAQEFGSSRNPAHPYLRPALESQAQSVVNNLSSILARRLNDYKIK